MASPLTLRLVYAPLVASSLLFLASGDARSSLTVLMVLLAYAGMVERALHVFEAVSVILSLGSVAVGLYVVYAFKDVVAGVLAGVCALSIIGFHLFVRLVEAGLVEVRGREIIIKLREEED